jgi:Predicted hydrolases or acyltransferases (alpha/beta hydrolase superfamily)
MNMGNNWFIRFIVVVICLCISVTVPAQVNYPYPIQTVLIKLENKPVKMAFMDIHPDSPARKTVVLLHGKNFNGYYWKDVMTSLVKNNYRVIVPDQPGWGRSDKPDLHYSFHILASATRMLLDTLKVQKMVLVGHSMGGMLAARFAMMYPDKVEKLVLEDPIGLEDYKRFVPYQPLDLLYQKEKSATYESYKKYQQTYYPQWKPEYEQYVQAQAEALQNPDFAKTAWVNALTYQMIYEQPVCYEWDRINAPTLLIIGSEDRTVVGKALLPEEERDKYGQYPALAKKAKELIPNAVLVELPGIGHIPHIQDPPQFQQILLTFIQ